MINSILEEKKITKYRLSKMTGIPYATINDICSGKADIRHCTIDTVYKISDALGMSIDDFIAPYYLERPDFELFKSNVCHKLKETGDTQFIIALLKSGKIFSYYKRGWYAESLYLLSMLDYLCRINSIPVCRDFSEIRKLKLAHIAYPASIIAASAAAKTSDAKSKAVKEAIPEFLEHNIIESDIRNVI